MANGEERQTGVATWMSLLVVGLVLNVAGLVVLQPRWLGLAAMGVGVLLIVVGFGAMIANLRRGPTAPRE